MTSSVGHITKSLFSFFLSTTLMTSESSRSYPPLPRNRRSRSLTTVVFGSSSSSFQTTSSLSASTSPNQHTPIRRRPQPQNSENPILELDDDVAILSDLESSEEVLPQQLHRLRTHRNHNRSSRFSLDSVLEVLEEIVFNYLLSLTLIWQLFLVFLVQLLQPDAFAPHRSADLDVNIMVWLGQAIQLLIMVLANLDAAKRVRQSMVPLGGLIKLYIANSFVFAGLYYACFLSNERAFRVDLSEAGPFGVYVVFVYFSMATQGTAGFGDIVPLTLPSQTLACLQMLAAVCYSVAIFVVGTAHICLQREEYLQRRIPTGTHVGDGLLETIEKQAPGFSYWGEPVKRMPLLVTALVLSFNLAIVYMADDDINVATATQVFLAGVALITQTFQALIVLGVSVSLVRKIESEEVTSGFLAQSYLSTAVLFSGMYFAIFLVEGPESWNLVDDKVEKNLTLPGMVYHFTYFSITTQSSCGYGDYYPRTTAARILVCVHLIVSMSYTAVVLGLGMSHLVDHLPAASTSFTTSSYIPARTLSFSGAPRARRHRP